MRLTLKKWMFGICIIMACTCLAGSLFSACAAETLASSVKKEGRKTPRSCWVKKNGDYYYYNNKGRLLKNGIHKIKGVWYNFDRTGRRISDTYKGDFYFTFNKKTGKNTAIYMYLKIRDFSKDSRYQNIVGSRYEKAGKNKVIRGRYIFSAGNAKITDKTGKRLPYSSLSKGDLIKVYVKSPMVKETDPAQIGPVTKIVLLRK